MSGSPGDYVVQIVKMACPGCQEEVEVEVKIRLIDKVEDEEILDLDYKIKHGDHGGGGHMFQRLVFRR